MAEALRPVFEHFARYRDLPEYTADYEALTAAVERGNRRPAPLGLLPEEVAETTGMPRLATWGELNRELLNPNHRVLEQFRDQLRTSGFVNIALNFELTPDDFALLANLFADGEYVVTGLVDKTARLLRVKRHGVAMLSPFITNGRINWGAPIVVPHAHQHP